MQELHAPSTTPNALLSRLAAREREEGRGPRPSRTRALRPPGRRRREPRHRGRGVLRVGRARPRQVARRPRLRAELFADREGPRRVRALCVADARHRDRGHGRPRAQRRRGDGRGVGARLRAADPRDGAGHAGVEGEALRSLRAHGPQAPAGHARRPQVVRAELREVHDAHARRGAGEAVRRRSADHAGDRRERAARSLRDLRAHRRRRRRDPRSRARAQRRRGLGRRRQGAAEVLRSPRLVEEEDARLRRHVSRPPARGRTRRSARGDPRVHRGCIRDRRRARAARGRASRRLHETRVRRADASCVAAEERRVRGAAHLAQHDRQAQSRRPPRMGERLRLRPLARLRLRKRGARQARDREADRPRVPRQRRLERHPPAQAQSRETAAHRDREYARATCASSTWRPDAGVTCSTC